MKRIYRTAVRAGLLAIAASACFAAEEVKKIDRTFSGVKRLEVENIWGGIKVVGVSGTQASLHAVETIQAGSPEEIAEARKRLRLEITEKDGLVSLIVDGPGRCNSDCGGSGRAWARRRPWQKDEKTRYDIELQVPAQTALALSTVNEGDIRVEKIDGDFEVHNVNGGVEIYEAGGSGRAYALNKPLKVTFRKNPARPSYFGSLNGRVDLLFQSGLSADFQMKTFNGKVYSDFPMTSLPASGMAIDQRGAVRVLKSDQFTRARVGSGGPEIKLDGFNGDMRILQRGVNGNE